MSQSIDFTPEARRVLSLASRELAELGHGIIGTEHVLLALVSVKDAGIATTFANLGVDPAAVRATTLGMLGIPSEQQASGDQIAGEDVAEFPFSQRMKYVIECAMQEAREFGSGRVTSSVLLLGLLREGEGVAAVALARHGVTVEQARSASMMSHH
jgi:ATP-dependent Clp protease ATP-binding subunit ClpC